MRKDKSENKDRAAKRKKARRAPARPREMPDEEPKAEAPQAALTLVKPEAPEGSGTPDN